MAYDVNFLVNGKNVANWQSKIGLKVKIRVDRKPGCGEDTGNYRRVPINFDLLVWVATGQQKI